MPLQNIYIQFYQTWICEWNKDAHSCCFYSTQSSKSQPEQLDTQKSWKLPNWNGRSKLPLFADDTALYIRNPKDSTKKLLELWNKFSKIAEYKINIQKSVVFLYNNNKLSERERNNKCWQGCEEKEQLCSLWELKLVRPLWETVWRFLKN